VNQRLKIICFALVALCCNPCGAQSPKDSLAALQRGTATLKAHALDAAHSASSLAQNTASLVQDAAISGYINTKIAFNRNLADYDIDVSTNQGVVSLSGTLYFDSEASELIEMTTATAGVTGVDANKLSIVRSQQSFSDLVIAAKIRGLLVRERLLNNKSNPQVSIRCESKKGVVRLTGTATELAQLQRAIRLSRTIKGVTRIESEVKIAT